MCGEERATHFEAEHADVPLGATRGTLWRDPVTVRPQRDPSDLRYLVFCACPESALLTLDKPYLIVRYFTALFRLTDQIR